LRKVHRKPKDSMAIVLNKIGFKVEIDITKDYQLAKKRRK
jgi:hypothetical protein